MKFADRERASQYDDCELNQSEPNVVTRENEQFVENSVVGEDSTTDVRENAGTNDAGVQDVRYPQRESIILMNM